MDPLGHGLILDECRLAASHRPAVLRIHENQEELPGGVQWPRRLCLDRGSAEFHQLARAGQRLEGHEDLDSERDPVAGTAHILAEALDHGPHEDCLR